MQDMFDKVSCYFPINFTPPKDDKFKITPSRLQESLNHCFLSTEHKEWVDSIVPFVLEKMDADANSRKVCLELLKQILDKFDHQGPVKDHLQFVVMRITNDFFNIMNAEVQKHTRETLANIINCIEYKRPERAETGVYIGNSHGSMSPQTFKLVEKCLQEIEGDPEGMSAYLSSQLLSHVVGHTKSLTCKRILTYLLVNQGDHNLL